jgi:hypothetical protein
MLIHLGRRPSFCLEPIEVGSDNLDHDELFVELARRIVPDPYLVVWSLQHYGDRSNEDVEIIDRMNAAKLIKRITKEGRQNRRRKTEKTTIINRGVLKLAGDRYSANQAGAMGPHAQATNNTFIQTAKGDIGVRMKELLPELAKLRAEMRKEASEPEHDIAVAEIAKAESAATKGDAQGLIAHLKAAGKWAGEIAGKVGTAVAEKAIESAMGLG